MSSNCPSLLCCFSCFFPFHFQTSITFCVSASLSVQSVLLPSKGLSENFSSECVTDLSDAHRRVHRYISQQSAKILQAFGSSDTAAVSQLDRWLRLLNEASCVWSTPLNYQKLDSIPGLTARIWQLCALSQVNMMSQAKRNTSHIEASEVN